MQECQELMEKYWKEDRFPLSLGIELLEISPGYSRVRMEVREDMVNFHGITHGGALFALADTAFGLASNTRGTAVALQVSCNFMAPSQPGSVLEASAREEHLTRSTGIYSISVEDRSSSNTIAVFRGVVYRKKN